MSKTFFILASFSGFLGVAFGAFGAHGLKNKLSPEFLQIFETGVRYQMYHVFALFAVSWAIANFHAGWATKAGWLFTAGTIIFSGSLYILTLSGVRTWGAVTPIGGVLLLVGWIFLIVSGLRS